LLLLLLLQRKPILSGWHAPSAMRSADIGGQSTAAAFASAAAVAFATAAALCCMHKNTGHVR
jgi:hypothetical protein